MNYINSQQNLAQINQILKFTGLWIDCKLICIIYASYSSLDRFVYEQNWRYLTEDYTNLIYQAYKYLSYLEHTKKGKCKLCQWINDNSTITALITKIAQFEILISKHSDLLTIHYMIDLKKKSSGHTTKKANFEAWQKNRLHTTSLVPWMENK